MQFNCTVNTILLFSTLIFTMNVSAYLNAGDMGAITENQQQKRQLEPSLWEQWKQDLLLTWDSSNTELYVPIAAWHNRFTYSDEKIKSYNELAWGMGYGTYRFDTKNNWHSLYAMAFMDSHNKIQPVIGYGYQKMWTFGEMDKWRFGAGFALSITGRHEYHYIPIPLPLPLFSIEYHRLSLQTSYIPGSYNNGNVLFVLARWQL